TLTPASVNCVAMSWTRIVYPTALYHRGRYNVLICLIFEECPGLRSILARPTGFEPVTSAFGGQRCRSSFDCGDPVAPLAWQRVSCATGRGAHRHGRCRF